MNIGVSGRYEFFKNGELVGKTDNLVLDSFFTRYCSGGTNYHGHLTLGTGTTAPVVTDTGLEAVIAGTNDYFTVSNTSVPREDVGGNTFITIKWTHEYSAASFSNAAISEVGFRMHTSATPPADGFVDSRALIRDINGDPATINKTSEDALTVFYYFSFMIPTSVSSEMTFGANVHKVTLAPANTVSWNGGWPNGNLSGWGTLKANNRIWYDTTGTVSALLPIDDVTLQTPVGYTFLTPTNTTTSGSNSMTFLRGFSFSQSQMITGITHIYLINGVGFGTNSSWQLLFEPPVTDSIARTVSVETKFTLVRGVERTGGKFTSPMTTMVLPTTITEAAIPIGAYTSSGSAGAVPVGGRAPYTFAWTLQSAAGTPALSADSPTLGTTTFTGTGASLNNSVETWRCTITDFDGNTAFADTVVDLTWVA